MRNKIYKIMLTAIFTLGVLLSSSASAYWYHGRWYNGNYYNHHYYHSGYYRTGYNCHYVGYYNRYGRFVPRYRVCN